MSRRYFGSQTKSVYTNKSSSELDSERNLILSRTLQSAGANVLKCTILDAQGRVQLSNGGVKRSELISQHGLFPRDLRKIDVSTYNIVPSILVRDNSILVNLLHIRALIKADMVILFDVDALTDSKTRSLFLYELEHRLRVKAGSHPLLPYELRALETILISVSSTLDSELKLHTVVIEEILRRLDRTINREQLRYLLVQSKQLSAFLQKVTLILEALQRLIDSDEDMADLNLTAKMEGKPLSKDDDISDIQIMLESYYNLFDEIVQTTENLISNIKATEEIINIVLDSNRNELMLLELRFQIGMLGLSTGSVIAAIYGMNLKNFIEDTWWGFGLVTTIIGISSFATVAVALRRLAQLRKMHLSDSMFR